MTISSFKFLLAFSIVAAVCAPPAYAQDAAADQVQLEQQDQTAIDAVPAPVKKPGEKPAAKDVAEMMKSAPAPDAAAATGTAAAPTPAASSDDDNIAVKTKKAIERATAYKTPEQMQADIAHAPKPQKAPLGSLTMREPTLQLNQLELWREDAAGAVPNDIWDGTDAADVQMILPALVMTKKPAIKTLLYRTAMSAVYSPDGMNDADYVRWRADVMMAQHHPELAARLMNALRLGRDSNTDAQRRIAYELVANKAEAACLEVAATPQTPAPGEPPGQLLGPFWQGMNLLCAEHQADKKLVQTLLDGLADGPMKTAADSSNDQDLPNAILHASGAVPASKEIPNNHDIMVKLQALLDRIHNADDAKLAAKENKGELLLLALGALRADKHDDNTDELTDSALALAGFPNE